MPVGFTTAAALVHEPMEARDETRLLNLRRQFSRLSVSVQTPGQSVNKRSPPSYRRKPVSTGWGGVPHRDRTFTGVLHWLTAKQSPVTEFCASLHTGDFREPGPSRPESQHLKGPGSCYRGLILWSGLWPSAHVHRVPPVHHVLASDELPNLNDHSARLANPDRPAVPQRVAGVRRAFAGFANGWRRRTAGQPHRASAARPHVHPKGRCAPRRSHAP